jgi:hypothetical protein
VARAFLALIALPAAPQLNPAVRSDVAFGRDPKLQAVVGRGVGLPRHGTCRAQPYGLGFLCGVCGAWKALQERT